MLIGEKQTVIYGPPGTGKTSTLLDIVEKELAEGVSPARIAYLSFTKQAVNEAVSRAEARFGYQAKDLPYFKTLHSLCYSACSITRSQVLGPAHLSDLGTLAGYRMFNKSATSAEDLGLGQLLVHMEGLARNKRITLEDAWHDINDPRLGLHEVIRFSRILDTFKEKRGLIDFTDMLEIVVDRGAPLDLDVVIIDEAQDLTRLQWLAAQRLFHHAQRVYIAGDDDQAIFGWSGADIETFQNLRGEHRVLGTSHRVPKLVHNFAIKVIQQVNNRVEKAWAAKDAEGDIIRMSHLDAIDIDEEGTWLFLARNAYFLDQVEGSLVARGYTYMKPTGVSSVNEEECMAIVYWERLRKGERLHVDEIRIVYKYILEADSPNRLLLDLWDARDTADMAVLVQMLGLKINTLVWHEALKVIPFTSREYYRSILRRGGSLSKKPRIRISTIHGAKGAEADNVVLLCDLSKRSYDAYMKGSDEEQRVLYVAMTRTKDKLYLVDPETTQGYQFL